MFELIPFDRRNHSVSAFDPFRAFDDMERSFFRDVPSIASFRTDVTDTGDAYKLEAELPGFKKEDIKIDVEDDCLTISAERKVDEDKKDEKNNFVKRERYYGSYSRSFDVSGINIDGIEASYTDGVLTLTMPKKAAEIPASRRLEIK
ncbi:MAG: Hsp20/alpha crystallin family protein [Candidatus Limivicinus sp.]|nr:Hsp20/alpha crystallin family protein [Candidatus Limivicinus sp.]MDY5083819.1 Hsp20/alpha crystallin family protein [Candidatus Limivicinus sp.]